MRERWRDGERGREGERDRGREREGKRERECLPRIIGSEKKMESIWNERKT
jgi:hypothetical protein